MDNKERLQKLKQLKVARKENVPLFKTSNECLEWIDNVAPLLKYDGNHYAVFMNNAQYVRITTLSSDRLMIHLNPMIGTVNQAIIELENKIESPIPNTAPNPATDEAKNKKPPGGISLNHFAFGVGIIIFAAIFIWVVKHYLSLKE